MATQRTQTAIPTPPPFSRATRTAPSAPSHFSDHKESPEERIRFRAYLLAEAAGFPAGRADEFWFQAEREFRSGNSR